MKEHEKGIWKWISYNHFSITGMVVGMIIGCAMYGALIYKPEGLPDTKEVKWVSHYMKVHNTEPCIFNQWEGKPDDIVMCFNDSQSAIWAFKSLKKDIKAIDNILNGTKGG